MANSKELYNFYLTALYNLKINYKVEYSDYITPLQFKLSLEEEESFKKWFVEEYMNVFKENYSIALSKYAYFTLEFIFEHLVSENAEN